MELKDTVKQMVSPDYKERFIAEYCQLKIRCEKLKAFNTKIEAAEATRYKGAEAIAMPKHDCPDNLLQEQQFYMEKLLHVLELRATIEGIELKEV